MMQVLILEHLEHGTQAPAALTTLALFETDEVPHGVQYHPTVERHLG